MLPWRYNYSSEVKNMHAAEAYSAQAKRISDLIGESHEGRVVVPTFQRGYSWGKKHVDAFWRDIEYHRTKRTAKGAADKYFLGPIVIMPSTTSDNDIVLLDGQQRLATATILLSVLRDVGRDLKITDAIVFADKIQNGLIYKEDVGYSLELGELDKVFFIDTIQQDPRLAHKKPSLLSHRNIKSARDVLEANVKALIAALSPPDALKLLKDVFKVVRNELVMASILVLDEGAAFNIFETLNDRGLRLSVPDLLLNYLMRTAESNEIRQQIRGQWNDMVEGMGKRDPSRFIRHMWLSKYGDLKNIDLFSALKDHIETNKKESLEFAQTCAAECTRYVELAKADEEHLEDAAPYVKRLILDLGVDAALPVLLSAHSVLSTKDLADVAKWLLVFITRYSVVVGLDPGGLENIFYALARDIRTTMNGAKPNDKDKVKETRALIKGTLSKNAPDDNALLVAVKRLTLEPDEAKYVVFRLATVMQTKTKEITIDESNLEHIFPKKPSADWKNPEELEPYLWHLGNLTMLGERLNTGAASKGYPTKKTDYYLKSELTMARKLAEGYSKWDAKGVIRRAESFGKLITQVWDFNNTSRV
jgi:hypothetical protein